MKKINKTISTFIELSNIEYQTYDLKNQKLICSSGFAQKLLGYTEQEFNKLSSNFYESLIHPDDLDLTKSTIDKVINSTEGEIIEDTIRYKKSDGNYIWAYSRKMIVERNSEGKPSIIYNLSEDISGFIILENQLKEKIQNLKDISWKNSHLLRGPVAGIIGLIDEIQEEEITSQHNMQVFLYIKQAVEKLDAVIHEINRSANSHSDFKNQTN